MIRAVVVRPTPGYSERAQAGVDTCIWWIQSQGWRLVGVADAAGAMKMHADGGADVVVASHAHHVPPPDHVKIVADEITSGPRRPRWIPTQERRRAG
ncbi:hypothetical protein [Asanoa iriomotensis]|uniref:Uncharacterized protein n=1 Tax=Asanoa iriomotensis TaxID=234613 RepID=A0ABQ4BUN2_9ACTN|nr:hypothetical protein [Asanoa iriomotensis]GIF54237.1 hypothetical protein Air01nite_03320 [Asanoa iriomotensis]